MRILHISDLHFGAHNSDLADDLRLKVAKLKPDVILATGDLADQPEEILLTAARTYLGQLQSQCCNNGNGAKSPRLMVVPGNHDARYYGSYRFGAGSFHKVFADLQDDLYDETENIWIYGIDSSLEFRTGANGRVSADSLYRFRARYQELQKKPNFDAAFKIIALHHHPLPIKYDDKQARWLTLTNAAEFLGEMLKKEVNLILHGHEHVRSLVRYGRQFRHNLNREVPVLSLGTTLKQDHGEEHNCFYLIDIENYSSAADVGLEEKSKPALHNAHVTCYEADMHAFNDDPYEEYSVVSESVIRAKYLNVQKARAGYIYGDVASIAKINSDGDASRIVECQDLLILDSHTSRARHHKISIPRTSGYIDKVAAKTIRSDGLKVRLKQFQLEDLDEGQSAVGDIVFNQQLNKGTRISYNYSWWAVNSFALNQREAGFKYDDKREVGFKYGDRRSIEFTHYPVHDPMEALTVIVRFPEDSLLSPLESSPRVVNLQTGQRDTVITDRLVREKALRHYESLRTIALRVTKPLVGYSYGIEWTVPESAPAPKGVQAGQLEDIVDALVLAHDAPTEGTDNFMKGFLFTVAESLRNALIPGSTEELEVSLMVFDTTKRRLVVVASAWIAPGVPKFPLLDFSKVEFRYGEGICGKAFKTNSQRLYTQVTEDERRQNPDPDFYRHLPGINHAALFGIPVQSPEVPTHVYGVIGCGAHDRSSKLWELSQRSPDNLIQDLNILRHAQNKWCFELMKDEFLTVKTT